MPDQLAGLPEGDASVETPVEPSVDIEKIKTDLEAQVNERIKGFQRLLDERDKKLDAYERELEEFKTAGLSEEEREQLISDRLTQENAKLRGRIEVLELAKEYGDEVPVYERLLQASTAEEQLKVLRELRTPPAQADNDPARGTEVEIPDTDPNRPMRTPQEGIVLSDGTRMNDALADRILGSVSVMADVTQRRLRPTD